MSTQEKIICSNCNCEIDVSEVANEYVGCGYFHDGAVIGIVCDMCGNETEVEVNIHVSYEVVENKKTISNR
ncbi:MAG: hypothetical protein [Caudoviricetes sp.]|nr:MAG: hypothetical protein [Caudoviricetes sp.]